MWVFVFCLLCGFFLFCVNVCLFVCVCSHIWLINKSSTEETSVKRCKVMMMMVIERKMVEREI